MAIDMESKRWYPPKSLNEKSIKVGFKAIKIYNILFSEYLFIKIRNKKIFTSVNKIKKTANVFFGSILNVFSIKIIMVPNKPLLINPPK
jgi:hypothetical protein